MINEVMTIKGLRYDILQNGRSKYQMGALVGLTKKDLEVIQSEIEAQLWDIEMRHKTNRNGVHPQFGKVR